MELVYVYIKKKGHNIGLNLSNKYEVTYKDNLLKITKTGRVPLYGEKISNITALIGANGVGKTSTLKEIAMLDFSKHSNDGFFIYEEKQELNIVNYTDVVEYDENTIIINPIEECDFTNTKFVFYDNIFNPFLTINENNYVDKNGSFFTKTKHEILDISTNYKYLIEAGDKVKFCSNEVKNSLKLFINEIREKKILPKEIIVPTMFKIKNSELTSLTFQESNNPKMKEEKDKFNFHFIKNICHIYLKNAVIQSGKFDEFMKNNKDKSFLEFCKLMNEKFSDKKTEVELTLEFQKELMEKVDDSYKSSGVEKDIIHNTLQKCFNIINAYYKFCKDTSVLFGEVLYLEIEETNLHIQTLLDKIKDNSIGEHFFEYSYDIQFSSGEMALITLYSRLLNIRGSVKEEDSIILFLDEPEITAHPEWQRKFIYSLNLALKNIFNCKSIQVILTSHSPFIPSDLPKENVIMLEKSDDGKCIVKDNKIDTFGANIFNLYKEAFFVESSFGEFAREKIQDIANLYEKNKDEDGNITYPKQIEIEDRKDKIKYIISSVGEPLIKRKLQDIYDEYETNKLNNAEDKKLLEEFNELSMEEKLQLMKLKKENNGDKK